ncbi:MAG: hypothetical protein ABFQ89_06375 [Chloroflexota bacterium]
MKLNAPKQITWLIALVLVVLGILGQFVGVDILANLSFWFMFIAAVLLLVATYLPGL